jgi:hypothetical protein
MKWGAGRSSTSRVLKARAGEKLTHTLISHASLRLRHFFISKKYAKILWILGKNAPFLGVIWCFFLFYINHIFSSFHIKYFIYYKIFYILYFIFHPKFSLPINRACDNYNCRPPTSCRVFLIRTLPPPPHPWIRKQTSNRRICKRSDPKLPSLFYFVGPFYLV